MFFISLYIPCTQHKLWGHVLTHYKTQDTAAMLSPVIAAAGSHGRTLEGRMWLKETSNKLQSPCWVHPSSPYHRTLGERVHVQSLCPPAVACPMFNPAITEITVPEATHGQWSVWTLHTTGHVPLSQYIHLSSRPHR